MSRLDWTEILLKLLVLMNLFGVVSVAPSVVGLLAVFSLSAGTVDSPVGWIGLFAFALLFLVPIVIAVVIWKNTRRIAAWLWRSGSEERAGAAASVTCAEVKVAAFSGVGLYVLVMSVPSFIQAVVELFRNVEMFEGYPEATLLQLPQYTYVFGQVVRFVLAIVLVVSPQRVVRLLDRMWNLLPTT